MDISRNDISLALQFETPLSKKRYNSERVGMEEGKYWILTIPPIDFDAISGHLASGNPIIVRFMNEGVVCAFQSRVIACVLHPYKLVFVEYPQDIKHYPLRKYPRTGCALPAAILMGGEKIHGSILDISMGGCRFCSMELSGGESLLKNDDLIYLSVKIPGIQGDHTFSGILKNHRQDKDKLFCGVAFENMDVRARDVLNAYISAIASA